MKDNGRIAKVKTIYVVIVALVIAIASLPMWHRHPGLTGIMHGHSIWTESHQH